MFMWRPQSLMGLNGNQTQRDNTKQRLAFLMGFVLKMYVFGIGTRVIVNNLTFDELNRNRNNKTITEHVFSSCGRAFMSLSDCFRVDCSYYSVSFLWF